MDCSRWSSTARRAGRRAKWIFRWAASPSGGRPGMSESKRVAIVTGASRGIGRACAKALATAGLDVYLVAEGTEAELVAACTECVGARAEYGVFDLAQP